ncbi:sulfite exporter TauE/SafE family protein [Geobacter pickeringii]|uniref:Probable membrane transporter protein n=1 Tax=Geobacter pickeringii TaxID=345632 RepID=A0A0B5BB50_9BACT|nr:sulfite exporter TauE/SafE family protein [Geobacter pickeringii]AJE02169.1 hypothetical protein GPICK_01165 [Geobacter pickeringii]
MATSLLFINLFMLGVVGGCLSGLLGIGGGIIMLPLLTTVPLLAGVPIPLRPAVGITMLQSLTGSISGILIHRKYRALDLPLAVSIGGSGAIGSLGGAVFSQALSERLIAILFTMMALTSLLLLLIPEPTCPGTDESLSPRRYPASLLLGGGVGFLAGIIGQGGAFIILPLMIHVFKVPVRTAIGTTTGVAFFSAFGGFLGKWGTSQVPFLWGIAVSIGALLGGQVGAILSHRLPTATLRRILFVLVAFSAVRIFVQVLP